jgi:hypothetical protein
MAFASLLMLFSVGILQALAAWMLVLAKASLSAS